MVLDNNNISAFELEMAQLKEAIRVTEEAVINKQSFVDKKSASIEQDLQDLKSVILEMELQLSS